MGTPCVAPVSIIFAVGRKSLVNAESHRAVDWWKPVSEPSASEAGGD